ncbi:MAG TPA: NAD(P)-dependent oxidoreductase [Microlunatus sp.]|nr:NAD(P)-dependent oxidoreductase [Microlunatus sp.]
MRTKVLLDPSFRLIDTIFTDVDLQRIHAVADVVWGQDEPIPEDRLSAVAAELEIIVTGAWRHGHPSRFPQLRAILEIGGHLPPPADLDYAYCFSHGIRVLGCAPAFGPAVAELGLGLALASCRQIAWTDRAFRTGEPNWSHTSFATEIGDTFTLYGKQIGMIGFGGLARSLRPLLAPFGCPIQVYDPWLTETFLRGQGVAPVDLDAVLSTSRVIFVLATPTTANRALLTGDKLDLISADAVLVLLSRSHVVDFDALTERLLAGRFRAAVDVFPDEPIGTDHPIRRAEHAVLSSHRAGAISEGLHNVGRLVADDLEALCTGRVPQLMQVAQPEIIRLRD